MGREPHFQHYVEDAIHVSPEAPQEAVCRHAVDLNVRGFIDWLQGVQLNEEAEDEPVKEHDEEGAEGDMMVEVPERSEVDATNRGVWVSDTPAVHDEGPQISDDRSRAGSSAQAGEAPGSPIPHAPHAGSFTPFPLSPTDIAMKLEREDVDLFTPRVTSMEIDWQLQLACKCSLTCSMLADTQSSATFLASLRPRTRRESPAAPACRRSS